MVVVDATLVVAALLRGGAAARRLGGTDVSAPHALDADVAALLARHLAAGHVSAGLATDAVEVLRHLVVDRVEHAPLLPRAWELRDHLAPGAALCVALAEVLDVPLATCDARTAAVPGLRTSIEVVPA